MKTTGEEKLFNNQFRWLKQNPSALKWKIEETENNLKEAELLLKTLPDRIIELQKTEGPIKQRISNLKVALERFKDWREK